MTILNCFIAVLETCQPLIRNACLIELETHPSQLNFVTPTSLSAPRIPTSTCCLISLLPLLSTTEPEAHPLPPLSPLSASAKMTRPVQQCQAIYPSFTSVVTSYTYWSFLGVLSSRVVRNLLPVHPCVQANERTESNSIIKSLVRKLEMNEKEMMLE